MENCYFIKNGFKYMIQSTGISVRCCIYDVRCMLEASTEETILHTAL